MTCEGMSYPKLSWWQPVLGDYFCPDGVDMIDLGYLAECWLFEDCGESSECEPADVNGDGVVNFADFAKVSENWLRRD